MINWETHPEYDKELLMLAKGDLTQMAIAEKMVDKFGLSFTRYSVKNRLAHIREKGYAVKQIETQFSIENDLNPSYPMTAAQYNKRKKEISSISLEIISTLRDELTEYEPFNKKETKGNKAGDSVVSQLTDWHVGKKIRDEKGNIIYNENVFMGRRDCLFNEELNLLDKNIKGGTPTSDVYVLSTGDLVDGQGIFASQITQQELSPPYQVMLVVKSIQTFLLSLLDRGLVVNFKAVKGNHGEIRYGGKSLDPLANWDLMVYLILDYWSKTVLQNDRFSMEYSELDYLNFYIQGWKYHIRHYAPVQPETAAGKAKFLGWYNTHKFDALAYGHFHHYGLFDVSTIPVFRGGSLTGMDEFSEKLAAKSDPVQLIWGVNKKRPLTFFYPVDLGEKGKR